MWLNHKVIKKWHPPFLHQPPFSVLSTLSSKKFGTPSPKWLNFCKVLPPLNKGRGFQLCTHSIIAARQLNWNIWFTYQLHYLHILFFKKNINKKNKFFESRYHLKDHRSSIFANYFYTSTYTITHDASNSNLLQKRWNNLHKKEQLLSIIFLIF